MCFPGAELVGSAVVAALGTAYGAAKSSQAQTQSANAISLQNQQTQQAQNTAFASRLAASQAQSNAQFTVNQQETADRQTAAAATSAAQEAALQRQNQTITQENQTADALRAQGDAQAQTLLQATNQPALNAAQTGQQDQAAALLAASQSGQPTGPVATNPDGSGASTSTNDTATKEALARRMGIAATNIRQYGADIAKVASYGEPLQTVGQAISANQVGIMPAQTASRLLGSGAAVRLLPSQIAYTNATNYGQAQDTAIQSDAAGKLQLAGLQYNDATQTANLGQSDTDTMAANEAAQAQANAKYAGQVGSLFAGIGNLAAYGTGYYGGGSGPIPGGGKLGSSY